MCGIAGFFRPNPTEKESPELLKSMNRALAHRGPDGEGTFLGGEAGLAHRRLAVIDLEGGRQPLVSEDGLTAIVINGEIYNYRELRCEMERDGRRFRTQSDTEVVLQAYEQWGERCIQRLRGMFAFAIWDQRKRALWLARDRMGLKPLYYYHEGPLFLFGSEIKAILCHPAVSHGLDERSIDDFLTLGYIPSPRTAYHGIRKLSAGHMLSVTARGVTETEYWDLDLTPHPGPRRGEVVEALRGALRGSISSHLVSDVPLGTLLSGGIDSTAMLASMAEEIGSGIPAFTASFPGTRDEDRAFGESAAGAFGAEWHDVPVPEPDTAILDRLARHYDEPFADASALPTFVLCERARRRVAVCLSGDGGDESFGGYRRHHYDAKLRTIRRFLPVASSAGMRTAAKGGGSRAPSRPGISRLGEFVRDILGPSTDVYWREVTRCDAALKGTLYSGAFRKALRDHDPFSILSRHLERSRGWDSTSQLMYLDFKTFLADGILTKVDRASMAHGLEVRVPLLDHMLVELAGRIPCEMKVTAGRGKGILRNALRDVVPSRILERRKKGFTPPLGRWLRGPLGSILEDRVLAGNPFVSQFLDVGSIRTLWEEQRRGVPGRSLLLWTILTLECWGRTWQ